MKLEDLFDVFYGTSLELNHLKRAKIGINFVSRTSKNNGITAIVEPLKDVKPLDAGSITVAAGGSVMSSFVQNKPFYTGRDIFYLKPKKLMKLAEKIYYCMCLGANRHKFSYGRQANRTLRLLELPDKIPSWVYKSKTNDLSEVKEPFMKKRITNLNFQNWKKFKIDDLFTVYTGGDKPKKNDPKHRNGILVNSIENLTENNGIKEKIFYNDNKKFKNFISISSIGVNTGQAFYQPELGAVFTRVKALVPKENTRLNPYTGMFIVTVFQLEKIKYSYGRVLDESRLSNTMIRLPSNSKGQPNWQFMEDYVKSLSYSSRLQN